MSVRVLLINNRPLRTGIGQYTEALGGALGRAGLRVGRRDWRNPVLEWFYQRLIRERLWNLPGRRFISYLEEATRIAHQGVFALTTPRNWEIYHVTSTSLAALTLLRRPAVVTVHDVVPMSAPRHPVDRLISLSFRGLLRADAVICVSDTTRRRLIASLPGLDAARIHVVWNGVDHRRFHAGDAREARASLDLPQEVPLLLHVGSDEPRRNVARLFEAFATLLHEWPDARLLRVGERTPPLVELERRLGIGDRVDWRPGLADVATAYSAADVCIVCSTDEGFSLPLVEAMASGLPVAASDIEIVREVAGDAATLFDPCDVGDMARGIDRAVNPARRAERRTASLERATLFDWDDAAQQVAAIYEQVLASGGS